MDFPNQGNVSLGRTANSKNHCKCFIPLLLFYSLRGSFLIKLVDPHGITREFEFSLGQKFCQIAPNQLTKKGILFPKWYRGGVLCSDNDVTMTSLLPATPKYFWGNCPTCPTTDYLPVSNRIYSMLNLCVIIWGRYFLSL